MHKTYTQELYGHTEETGARGHGQSMARQFHLSQPTGWPRRKVGRAVSLRSAAGADAVQAVGAPTAWEMPVGHETTVHCRITSKGVEEKAGGYALVSGHANLRQILQP